MKPYIYGSLAIILSTHALATSGNPHQQKAEAMEVEVVASIDSNEMIVSLSNNGSSIQECDTTTISWSNAFTGPHISTTFSVWSAGNHSFHNTFDRLEDLATSLEWQAQYPKGTILSFDVFSERKHADGSSEHRHGSLSNITIVPGYTSCIPAEHFPLVIKTSKDVTTCDIGYINWEGGLAPYTVSLLWDSRNIDGEVYYHQSQELGVLNDTSFGFRVDHPVGSVLQLSVQSDHWQNMRGSFHSGVSEILVVTEGTTSDWCVPDWHKRRRFPLWAIVVLSIVGGALAVPAVGGIVLYATKCIRARRHQPIAL